MKKTYPELVRHICEHPEMYVGDRRFSLVAAWLNGYSFGLYENQNTENVLGIDGFRGWLSERFYKSHGIERNLVWQEYISRLYPEDEDALKQLPVLVEEFVQTS